MFRIEWELGHHESGTFSFIERVDMGAQNHRQEAQRKNEAWRQQDRTIGQRAFYPEVGHPILRRALPGANKCLLA